MKVSDRAWRIGLLSVTAVAAAIRLHALDRFSYGLDEILEAYWTHGSWEFLWKSIRFDAIHPPLDYVVVKLFETFGPADWARKLPAVAWGTTTVPLVALLLQRRAGRPAGLTAAALLALAPFHVRYSQELRPYALGLFLLVASLLALERALRNPTATRVAVLYASCLATGYTAYLAGLVLAIAAVAMLIDDALSAGEERRSRAKRFLFFSPLFAAALAVAYAPWIPVVVEAARRPPPVARSSWTWSRVGETISFFAFASDDGTPISVRDLALAVPAVVGLAVAIRTRGLRWLAVWAGAGFAAIEILTQLHPNQTPTRRFLVAGIALVPIAALGLTSLLRSRRARVPAALLMVSIAAFDVLGLRGYFQNGRPDWRPLARLLRDRPPEEWVFTENAYTSLCLAFYVVGPESMYFAHRIGRPVRSLEGKPEILAWSWPQQTTTWVVTGPGDRSERLRDWLRQFPSTPYPSAEGSVLYRLDESNRESAFRGERAPRR